MSTPAVGCGFRLIACLEARYEYAGDSLRVRETQISTANGSLIGSLCQLEFERRIAVRSNLRESRGSDRPAGLVARDFSSENVLWVPSRTL